MDSVKSTPLGCWNTYANHDGGSKNERRAGIETIKVIREVVSRKRTNGGEEGSTQGKNFRSKRTSKRTCSGEKGKNQEQNHW